ncbi:hypothetical protein [Rhabdothermincola sp.]|uniref:hypothetical protein n=1 Tax=Rhabdothermincola sp. TaxID=2820405 RepID=UPI002FE0DC9B
MRCPCAARTLLLALSLPALACRGATPHEPTLPTVDFTPVAIVTASPDGLGCAMHPVGTPCQVPAGSVIEVRNDGPGERRLQAGEAFDTGIMRPGETTTVVLGDEPTTLEVRDALDPEATLELDVVPRAGHAG